MPPYLHFPICSVGLYITRYGVGNQLIEHEQNNHKGAECDVCKTYFNEVNELKKHKLQEHPTDKHKCNKCEKEFNTLLILENHVEKDHIVEVTYHCIDCDVTFSTEKELEAHRNKNHNTECQLCNLFIEKAMFAQHIKNDHEPSCSRCNKTFKTNEDREKYIESEHTQKTLLLCEECEDTFSAQDDLKNHMEKVHTNRNKYKCEYCELTLPNDDDLVQHMKEYQYLAQLV